MHFTGLAHQDRSGEDKGKSAGSASLCVCACACMCVSACARVWLYVYTFSCMSVPSITMSVCANVGSGRCPTCSGVRVSTFVYPVEVCVLCGYIWQLCMPCVAWVSQGTHTVGTPAYSLHKRLDVFGLSRVVWKGLCASGNGHVAAGCCVPWEGFRGPGKL